MQAGRERTSDSIEWAVLSVCIYTRLTRASENFRLEAVAIGLLFCSGRDLSVFFRREKRWLCTRSRVNTLSGLCASADWLTGRKLSVLDQSGHGSWAVYLREIEQSDVTRALERTCKSKKTHQGCHTQTLRDPVFLLSCWCEFSSSVDINPAEKKG